MTQERTPLSLPTGVSASLVEREIAGGVHWLRFTAALEQAYEDDTGARHIRHMTVSALIALGLYNLFLIADYLLIRDVMAQAYVVRLMIVTPLSVGVYLVMQHRSMVRYRDLFAVINVLLVVLSTSYLLVISKDPQRVLYNQCILLVIVYACLIQRLRFWYAVFCCVAVNAIFTSTLALQNLTPIEQPLAIEMIVLAGTLFSLIGAYTMEREHRLFYLISLKERLHAFMMEGISNRDALTGLFNRRALDSRLRDLNGQSAGWQKMLAVIIIDIDHFKIYNDRLGHQAGDDCLRQVAALILSHMRDGYDDAFRYGGEEFLLIVREADGERAAAIAERIRRALEERAIPHPDSSTGPCVTASFGVAHADVVRSTPAEIIARADMALYAAKNNGRNRVWPPINGRSSDMTEKVAAVAASGN